MTNPTNRKPTHVLLRLDPDDLTEVVSTLKVAEANLVTGRARANRMATAAGSADPGMCDAALGLWVLFDATLDQVRRARLAVRGLEADAEEAADRL